MNGCQKDQDMAAGQDFSAAFQAAAGRTEPAEAAALDDDAYDAAAPDAPVAGVPDASDDAPSDEGPAEPDYKALYEREAQRLRSLEGRRRREREDWRRLENEYRERLQDREDGRADESAWSEASSGPGPARASGPVPALSGDAPAPYRLARQAAEQAVRPVLDALERERHAAVIASAHPDWRDIAGDPELIRFIEDQPGYLASAMRRVVACGDADEVVELLTHFKESRRRDQAASREADRQGRRARLAQAAEAVPARPSGPPRGRPDKADFAAAWTEAAKSRQRR